MDPSVIENFRANRRNIKRQQELDKAWYYKIRSSILPQKNKEMVYKPKNEINENNSSESDFNIRVEDHEKLARIKERK